ncbi:MAG TPA: cation:proton antiporter [Polyangiaceae bacterium]|jgi:Kef-type K+ transport system membrane component KefB
MSSVALAPRRGVVTRTLQLLGLATAFALLWTTTRLSTEGATVAALGLFLVGGTLASELLEPLRIPHLTAYLAIGVVAGPHVLDIVRHDSVEELTAVNGLALALIAFAGGAELRIDMLKERARSLVWTTIMQCFVVLVCMALVFAAVSPLVPFVRGNGSSFLIGICLIEGVMGITRSPAAVLAILSQTRAHGRIANQTLAFVMLSDVVVIVLAAAVIALTKPLVEAGGAFSMVALDHLGHEIIGSIALGTSLGLLIVAYLKWITRSFLVVLGALGFGFTEVIRYLQFEPLLTFLVAGFLVQNLSSQGRKLLHAIEDMGSVVYVLFFATAGADLDLPLLRKLWPAALVLFLGRLTVTYAANAASTRLAKDPPELRRWGWAGLVSQAGVALGIASSIERANPRFGTAFKALAVATIAMNELFGPILFKAALDTTGESSRDPEPSRQAS